MAAFATDMEGPAAVDALNRLDQRIAGTAALAYAAVIPFDICTPQRTRDLLMTGNATINFAGVVNGVTLALGDPGLLAYDGFVFMLRAIQGGAGSNLITWGTGSRFGTDFTGITLSTTVGKGDRIALQYHHLDAKMDIFGYTRGF